MDAKCFRGVIGAADCMEMARYFTEILKGILLPMMSAKSLSTSLRQDQRSNLECLVKKLLCSRSRSQQIFKT